LKHRSLHDLQILFKTLYDVAYFKKKYKKQFLTVRLDLQQSIFVCRNELTHPYTLLPFLDMSLNKKAQFKVELKRHLHTRSFYSNEEFRKFEKDS